jgi:methylmalonyl-CoA mutase N-terminal domain/subunit
MVDFDAWRARVEKDGTSIAALARIGLEGVSVQALYDRGPAVPLVLPARAEPTRVIADTVAEIIDAALWHDAGATAVDEVALALVGVLEYDARVVKVALGGDLLIEIAKLRALRGLVHACGATVEIVARSGRRVRSRLDVDTNLVRATYELFAAVCAGVDAVIVEPHDRANGSSSDSQRWATNLVALMHHECGLADVDDPFVGSWAIESLTRALADAAWARARDIAGRGGLAAVIADGSLARDVAAAAAARLAAIADDSHPIVGVSKFPPPGRPAVTPTVLAPDGVHALDLCAAYEGGDR